MKSIAYSRFLVTAESPELGFGLFSSAHFVWLALSAAVISSVSILYRKAAPSSRRYIRMTVAAVMLAVELLKAVLLMHAGEYDIGRLPLHLCGLSIYMVFLHSLFPRSGETIYSQFLFAFCMPGAAAALIFPDWVGYPLFSFMTFAGFTLHSLIVLYVIMLVCSGDIVPDPRRLPSCTAIMLLIAVPVFFFDRLTGTNYMFLNYPSPGSPLEWFSFLGRPGYLLGFIPLSLIIWAVIYLPFILRSQPGKK